MESLDQNGCTRPSHLVEEQTEPRKEPYCFGFEQGGQRLHGLCFVAAENIFGRFKKLGLTRDQYEHNFGL